MTDETNIYAAQVLSQAPRLLSLMDREPHSASFGSLDRQHWAWKFRDFPLGMMQWGAQTLALLWRHDFKGNTYYRNPQVLRWCLAAMGCAISRQHRHGAISAFYPNERDPAVTLGVLYGLCETFRIVRDQVSAGWTEKFLASARRGFEFCKRGDEDHAFITNHRGAFALSWLNAYELFGEKDFLARSRECINQIVSRQSPDGWYLEYDGADPGYESLGVSYLAAYWQRTAAPELLESLKRSVEFYSHCIHPDGSVGGVYGSRHTQLYFPAGFEILSGASPAARAVADFMRPALRLGNVVTPAVADAENMPPLMSNYLLAALATRARTAETSELLPCEKLNGIRMFAASRIAVCGKPRYFFVVGGRKGGVCRMFDRTIRALVYEDAGYIARTVAGCWTSQLIGEGTAEVSGEEITCQAAFAKSTQRLPTPWNYWLFRTLNLTLFRSFVVGRILRRQIVAQLVTGKQRAPFRLRRTFSFGPDGIQVRDRIESNTPVRVLSIELPRAFTAIHMGSAKYFHPSELLPLPQPDVSGMAAELNRTGAAERCWSLQWDAQGQCNFSEGIQQQKSQEVEIGVPR